LEAQSPGGKEKMRRPGREALVFKSASGGISGLHGRERVLEVVECERIRSGGEMADTYV